LIFSDLPSNRDNFFFHTFPLSPSAWCTALTNQCRAELFIHTGVVSPSIQAGCAPWLFSEMQIYFFVRVGAEPSCGVLLAPVMPIYLLYLSAQARHHPVFPVMQINVMHYCPTAFP
jgi:hypothetical protein